MSLEPWTCEPNGPEVAYMLRVSPKEGAPNKTYAGMFDPSMVWPDTGYVEAKRTGLSGWIVGALPGLYGLLDGLDDWEKMPEYPNPRYIVFKVIRSEVSLSLGGASHFAPRGWVVYSGSLHGAMQILLPIMVRAHVSDLMRAMSNHELNGEPATITESFGSNADAGDSHAGALGMYSSAHSSGEYRFALAPSGCATVTGANSCAISGMGLAKAHYLRGDAIAFARSAAWAGTCGVGAALGARSRARAGQGGAIFLTEWDRDSLCDFPKAVFASKVGENGIKRNTWYELRDGVPVEVPGPS